MIVDASPEEVVVVAPRLPEAAGEETYSAFAIDPVLIENAVRLDEALRVDPKNLLAKYKRAMLMHMADETESAYEELVGLLDAAPREAPVNFLLGCVCKKAGKVDLAMKYFSAALDLDSKNEMYVKKCLENLDVQNIDDLAMMDEALSAFNQPFE